MKNTIFIMAVCLLTYCNSASAQYKYDVMGKPYTEISYTETEGDPYLASEWTMGAVLLPDAKSVAATLKFDTYSNRLLFQGKNGETMEFETKLSGFVIPYVNSETSNVRPLTFVKGYPPSGKQTEATWYQLVADGKVKLLKYYKKNITEYKAFNSATSTKSFIAFQVYYIFSNNQLAEISLNKKSILKSLNDHTAQLEPYLKTNNINFKSDADLQKLFAYYNSLN